MMAGSEQSLSRRLWNKDLTLWHPLTRDADTAAEIRDRLGWLDVFDWLPDAAVELERWAAELAAEDRFRKVIVLGMGGSSLAPLVLSDLFARRQEYPALSILDSTAPEMISRVVDEGVPDTLFIVASKSGTTLETTDLYRSMFHEVSRNSDTPGDQFVAITDAGSWLDQHAADAGFRKTFINPPEIGGRYSALSYFGMVPAALYGIDIGELVSRAMRAATRSRTGTVDDAERLGTVMGSEALAGRDKMLLRLDPELHSLGAWIEQLVAESTGKDGRGILPVVITNRMQQPLTRDAFEVVIGKDGCSVDSGGDRIVWQFTDPLDIGVEFLRWEFATAIAASRLGVNPFDQPNVFEAKQSTNRFIAGEGRPVRRQLLDREHLQVESANSGGAIALPAIPEAGNYIALLAYLPLDDALVESLQQLQSALAQQHQVQVTLGFGPRYLHSTGQLHKGGPPRGIFVIIDDPAGAGHSAPVIPGRVYTFAALIAAQADGDHAVLVDRGLPVMRVYLKGDRLAGIRALAAALVS